MSSPRPTYREYLPSALLHRLVECYWEARGVVAVGMRQNAVVLPDGCIDILFAFESGEGADRPGARVIGAMTQARDFEREGGVDLLGVRFRPAGARALWAAPAHEMTDMHVELADLWGPAGDRLLQRLQPLAPAARRRVLDRELLRRSEEARADLITLSAAEQLSAPMPPTVADLARLMGMSRRALERRLRESVGLSPWGLARIARFRRAADLLASDPVLPLSTVAQRTGYYDQPHFNREFLRLAGRTPTEYRDELHTR